MTAETLNFGPEWLRALSSGGSVTSPPPSPAMPKYKLAEYRYGREEMLALYVKDNKVPEDMQDKEFAAILKDEPLQPLALVPLTEEEQRNFSMSVNSVAVLRLMGKGSGAAPAGVARGRGSTRGSRGRGRGETGFYQRGSEDGELGFGRSVREINRSQSWDDRGERRFEKPLRRDGVRAVFEEAGSAPRKDYTRSDSENWRTLREDQEDEEGECGGSWRQAGARRDGAQLWEMGVSARRPVASRMLICIIVFGFADGGPRSAGWRELGGSGDGRRKKFDFDFREPLEGGRRRGSGDGPDEERDGLPEWCTDEEEGEMGTFDSSGAFLPIKSPKEPIPEEQDLEKEDGGGESEREKDVQRERKDSSEETTETKKAGAGNEEEGQPMTPASAFQPSADPVEPQTPHSPPTSASLKLNEASVPGTHAAQLSPIAASGSSSSSAATHLLPLGGDTEDEEGLKHLQQEAEKMVASLQDSSLDEESFTQTLQDRGNTAAALPLSHEAAMKWFYKDPQGEIQGPFTTQEMSEWFQAGYFSMGLLVKRGCDEGFQLLGDVIKMWGRVPFAPGPSPPPLLGNLDQERLKKQQELAAAALYQQLQQQQQQQQHQQQQQQLFHLINRCSEPAVMPLVSRSMSMPEAGSLWEMHTSASQQSGGEASLWDLTMNSTQGPTLDQLQKLQERRDAELRAKRDEEERKHREEKKRREEEEMFRRKQCRQQQELILKLLQQSQQQGAPGWAGPGGMAAVLSKQLQQEAERQLHKQQRERHGPLGGQWGDTAGGLWAGTGLEGKSGGSGGMGLWEEAIKNQTGLRSLGLKNSRSSPPISEPYLMARRKRTEEEEKLLKLLQGMKPQDGFTTWCEQMLHALSASTSTSSSLDVATIVAYLKEVESPYEVHDCIRSFLGDTVEAKEFAKQFLERRAKQKANHQRQQQQLSKELAGLAINFPLQDSMRGVSSSALQSMFQSAHVGKGGLYDSQGAKMRKKQPVMLHSDPSILGYSFHGGDHLSLGEMEPVEEY
ncbi:GRB10-interacting GYF protein 1-like isoform X3 [Paramormyrops kingsleyae]|uniref:GRB10-interacting GYF protein 1-like isoform X3 n=1 Tax=Paramormyrops kingsleyae TaxID=1676925 RepID=UPI000CD5FBE6|nr:GRB10-interacting GYF protein 1-like isoform X3 [Paramormyrops kingsleyae]